MRTKAENILEYEQRIEQCEKSTECRNLSNDLRQYLVNFLLMVGFCCFHLCLHAFFLLAMFLFVLSVSSSATCGKTLSILHVLFRTITINFFGPSCTLDTCVWNQDFDLANVRNDDLAKRTWKISTCENL